MRKKKVHIVSFDVPFPADYGGVIDVFSRIKWFAENGWEVILHCFEYERPQAIELEKYAEVHYYRRPTGLKYFFSKIPYIVNTRINQTLEAVLKNTEDTVILEGLHCGHYLKVNPGNFYLRTHNIEHEYYRSLAKNASGLKKVFYLSEARKLKKYEPVLSKAKQLLIISEIEKKHFESVNDEVMVVPTVFEMPLSYQETKPYVLFQGKLSVEENQEAVFWILKQIVPHLKAVDFVVAGRNPSKVLQAKCREQGVRLIDNPSDEKMKLLINEARIHLLWTSNSAGLKLKFVRAMATAGHVVCTQEMAAGSGLKEGFHLIESPQSTTRLIQRLISKNMDESDYDKRTRKLAEISGDSRMKDIFTINP